MSSIDDKQKKLLVELYEEHILPLAAHPETASVDHPPKPAGADSFFVVRARTRLEKEDFEVRLGDEEQVVATLERMWAGTPLVELPRALMKLTRHFQKSEEKSDVSAFIYEMF